MPRLQTLNARTAVHSAQTDVVPIVLITIDHPELDAPVRLSTDPTRPLSVDPLKYGTIHQGQEYLYALVSVPLPEQGDEASDTVTLLIDIVDPQVPELVSLVRSPARIDLVEVMSNAPDAVEFAFLDLEAKVGSVDVDAGQVSVEIGRQPMLDEPAVRDNMTADRLPGLHRR